MKSSKQFFLSIGTAVAGLLLLAAPATATPQPSPPGGPIEAFAAHNTENTRSLRHRVLRATLRTLYGEPNAFGGRTLDYGRMNSSGQRALDDYLSTLQAIDVTALSRDEQLAYWLNLYNAASLGLTLNEFVRLNRVQTKRAGRNPHRKVRLRLKKFYMGKDSPWADPIFTVKGTALSLNDIEHRILYAFWDNPMVVYGLACPAKGCPQVPLEPFTGHNVHAQLAAAAQRFISDKDNVDISGNTAEISELYRWNAAVFGGPEGVLAHLKSRTAPEVQPTLAAVTRIKGYDFNWSLAGKAPKPGWSMPMSPINRGTNPVGGIY